MGWYSENQERWGSKVYFTGQIAPPWFLSNERIEGYEFQKHIMSYTLPELSPGVYDQRLPNHIPKLKDNRYRITTRDCLEKMLRWWKWFNWMKYEPEDFDCDNFADGLYGILKLFTGWSNCTMCKIESHPNPLFSTGEDHDYLLFTIREDIDRSLPIYTVAVEPQNSKLIELGKGQLINYHIGEFKA